MLIGECLLVLSHSICNLGVKFDDDGVTCNCCMQVGNFAPPQHLNDRNGIRAAAAAAAAAANHTCI